MCLRLISYEHYFFSYSDHAFYLQKQEKIVVKIAKTCINTLQGHALDQEYIRITPFYYFFVLFHACVFGNIVEVASIDNIIIIILIYH